MADAEADADVVVVGAGPTGLMLAAELLLAGVRPLLLERQPQIGETPKANGFSGQILQLLRFRGLLDRAEAASDGPIHTHPQIPFGGVHLDTSHLAESPLQALSLPQPQLEGLLSERARELGADLRRGHELVKVSQNEATVTADVLGPDGLYDVTAKYLVGCDGSRSRVRDLAQIPFPGITYPEVNRLAQVGLHESIIRLNNGDLDVPGLGRIPVGFTRSDGGVFAFGSLGSGTLMIQTTEEDPTAPDDDVPLTLTEFQDSIRRVLGAHFPLGRATRMSRYHSHGRQAERYRDRRLLLAGDAAHQFPATGVGINVGMLDAVNLAWKLAADIRGWAPVGLLDSYHDERHMAGARMMMQAQAQVALRRGQDLAAEALRALFQELTGYEQPVRHLGEIIAGADIHYPPRQPNAHPLTGTFAPNLILHTGHGPASIAELMCMARPVLVDLADRPELQETGRAWHHRVDIHVAKTDRRSTDAMLIRPDGHIAWAAAIDESTDFAVRELREALADWFGKARS